MNNKKEQILDVSLALFLEKGYDNTSISDILSKLDIARGTLYYHFESKEAIMDMIIERSVIQIVKDAQKVILQKELNIYEKMFSLFASMSMKHLAGGELMIDYLNQPQNALFHEKSNRAFMKNITPLLGEIIKEGFEEGLFDNIFPYESAETILIMIMGFVDGQYEQLNKNDLERRVDSLLYNMERVLGAKEGSFAKFKTLAL